MNVWAYTWYPVWCPFGRICYLPVYRRIATSGVVVGLSISVSMILAATIGSLVPLILNRFDIDPAVATGPFVTTAIDVIGVAFYFIIAQSLLIGG